MKLPFGPMALALLTGCATSGTELQAECEALHGKFPDVYRCTYDAVAARNPRILKDARAKLYLLRGEQLAQQVESGKLSSLDAKVAWQQLFVELKAANDQEVMAAIGAMSQAMTAGAAAARAATPPTQPMVVTAPAAPPLAVIAPTPPLLQTPVQVNCTSRIEGNRVISTCRQ